MKISGTSTQLVKMTPGRASDNTVRLVAAIASSGRGTTLTATVNYISRLEQRPDDIVVCVPDLDDAGALVDHGDVTIVTSARGLTTQRNKILAVLEGNADVVVFLDDDFIPAEDFFVRMAAAFVLEPDIAIATGLVLEDGILGESISMQDAIEIIGTRSKSGGVTRDVYNAYGCNMAIRLGLVSRHRLSFDERLPLYGWLEDVDFSRLMARYGRSVQITAAQGVHLGVRAGRQPGMRLGYSQIANPFYMMGKKTISPSRAILQMVRNLAANVVGTMKSDHSVDRKGRLSGNIRAILDIMSGKSSPQRVLDIANPKMPSTTASLIKTAGK